MAANCVWRPVESRRVADFESCLQFGSHPVVKIDEMLMLVVWSGINEKAPSNDTAAVVVRLRGLLILWLIRRCTALAESLLSLR